MQFFRKVQKLGTWPRALLVGFVLAFGLNSIAHAAHQHDPTAAASSLHSTVCAYCISFDHLASAPPSATQHVVDDVELFALPVAVQPVTHFRPRATSQPRAPPIS
jgi:hypothetical protein